MPHAMKMHAAALLVVLLLVGVGVRLYATTFDPYANGIFHDDRNLDACLTNCEPGDKTPRP